MASVPNSVTDQVFGRRRLRLVALMGVAVATHAFAQSGAELEKAKGCPACHAPDAKKIGPAYAEIAARHRGDAGASDRLVILLKEGKRHPRVAGGDDELRALIGYVLNTR